MVRKRKHIGVDSFFSERKKMLDLYDQAKTQTSDDPVKTEHGFMAESLVRNWLSSFLPKRFGVSKGYIITHNLEYEGDLEEWDVIIYDAIDAPILFTRGSSDYNESGKRRAVPIEYVRAIIEVKATLTPTMAKKAADKILKLQKFIGHNDSVHYPICLCSPFVCTAIFFETNVSNLNQYRKALDNLSVVFQSKTIIPFMGALVLRSQRNLDHSGYLQAMCSDEELSWPDACEMSSCFCFPDGKYGSFGNFLWGVNYYPDYIFDLLAYMKGTKRIGFSSSRYGMDYENVQGSRLFH